MSLGISLQNKIVVSVLFGGRNHMLVTVTVSLIKINTLIHRSTLGRTILMLRMTWRSEVVAFRFGSVDRERVNVNLSYL